MLTARQQEALDIFNECNSYSETARRLGIKRQSATTMIKAALIKQSRMGITEDMDVSPHVGPGYAIKGVSTLVDVDGKAKLRWVKTDTDKLFQQEAMTHALEAMCEEIPRVDIVPPPPSVTNDLLNLYTITDYHLGMLAWGEETGADWDTDKAEQTLVAWFTQAIAQSPDSNHAVFAQLGDFLHWDGFDAITPSSGHLLDADTRFQKLVRVAIRVLRRVIDMLLTKHQLVTVIMAEGNHDMSSSIWLREMFSTLYENEPRIVVDTNPDPYYCVEHGECSLFFHHGHKKKPKAITEVFTAKFREVFGRTSHSFAHMGHMHHNLVEENSLMVVEQHRTLCAPDAYASRGGWKSGRDAKVIAYHRKYGEVARVVINYDMVSS